MNSNRILLKTLLQSTSRMNILRHTTDRKKRRKIIGAYIGLVCIYGMLMVYSILMCIGYGEAGMIDAVPMICALLISGMAFILTIFKTNGYLFNFKEYDMLMSLPFEARTVAGCKFLYMYVKSLPWYGSISVAMLIADPCLPGVGDPVPHPTDHPHADRILPGIPHRAGQQRLQKDQHRADRADYGVCHFLLLSALYHRRGVPE